MTLCVSGWLFQHEAWHMNQIKVLPTKIKIKPEVIGNSRAKKFVISYLKKLMRKVINTHTPLLDSWIKCQGLRLIDIFSTISCHIQDNTLLDLPNRLIEVLPGFVCVPILKLWTFVTFSHLLGFNRRWETSRFKTSGGLNLNLRMERNIHCYLLL